MKNKMCIILVSILLLTLITGCGERDKAPSELKLLGMSLDDAKIEFIHGNLIIYPDIEEVTYFNLMAELCDAMEGTSDELSSYDCSLEIPLSEGEGYAQNNEECYYVFITFSETQTMKKDGIEPMEQSCDGVLIDMTHLKVYWSKEGNFTGTQGFDSEDFSSRESFATFQANFQEQFEGIEQEEPSDENQEDIKETISSGCF